MKMLQLSDKQVENIYASLKGIEFEMNEGTIRSGKTFSDAQKMGIIYAASPDTNHLVSAYNQEQAFRMFFDGEGHGLINIFKNNGEMRSDRHGDHLWLNCTKRHTCNRANAISFPSTFVINLFFTIR